MAKQIIIVDDEILQDKEVAAAMHAFIEACPQLFRVKTTGYYLFYLDHTGAEVKSESGLPINLIMQIASKGASGIKWPWSKKE